MEDHPNVAAAGSLLSKLRLLSVIGLQGLLVPFAVSLFRKHPVTYLYILNDAETAVIFIMT